MSQINMEYLLSLNIFMFLYCRADWGYKSTVVKPPTFLFPYSLTLMNCSQAIKSLGLLAVMALSAKKHSYPYAGAIKNENEKD